MTPTLPLVSLLVLGTALPLGAAPIDELIAKGHAHATRYEEEQALAHFLAALKEDPENPDLLVAISREYRHLMSDAKSDAEKRKLGETALSYANSAATLAPRDAEAQLAPAITYGKMLPIIEGNRQKLEASRQIKIFADRAIALNPNYDLAWHILGRWHRGIAEVSGVKRAVGSIVYGKMPDSTYANAVACFRKAIALKPDRLMHYVELGCTYAEMGNAAEARKLITHGLALRETEKDDPATKQRGREALAAL